MTLAFRNLDAQPGDPVTTWPFEALVAAIERGTVSDWARLTKIIREDPWGVTARAVEEYLGYERLWGVAPLLERALQRARQTAEAAERESVAGEVRALVESSGLSRKGFAARIETSASRLSTYCSGRVTPSAAMLVRMRAAAERARRAR
jgi:DNA-binding transcriptional regulator YiaG